MTTCILVSGGLDSTIAFHLLQHKQTKIIPVFIDYNQSYLAKEIKACHKIYGDQLVVLKVDGPKQSDKTNSFVPNRNLFFASYITLNFNPDRIIMGGLADDNQVDKTPEIFDEMSTIISKTSNKRIQVDSILWNYTKGQAVEMFLKSGVPNSKEILLQAVSCYSEDNDLHCNDCAACYRRYVALMSNGIDCEPLSERIIDEYKKKSNAFEYDQDRLSRMRSLGLLPK